MKVTKIAIRNFRRLENVSFSLEPGETILVGPNNSGKTTSTAVFRCFIEKGRFKIHDFSVSRIAEIDEFGHKGGLDELPSIELDIWLAVDPDQIEYGRVAALLPDTMSDFRSVGIRLSYKTLKPEKLREAYLATYPANKKKPSAKSLSEYLTQGENLKNHFQITYAALKNSDGEISAFALKDDEGKSLLKSLIRVDFVDAQRNMHDEESHRSNRLSVAFSNFYKELLTQPEIAADARKVIDQNNQSLIEHYKLQFTGLLASISRVGTPSVYDRGLKLVSSIEPENALRGSTELYYVDTARNHELPELYNGLGFKNLIYMIIQTRLVHDQWARTEINRPLCHIIFIEEPEVHLHAQVQQTFILNIWNVLNSASGGETALSPQLVITTHSSHILDATEFGNIRHFRRCQANNEDINEAKILNASSIVSLRDFKSYEGEIKGKSFSENDTLAFLKKYLRLTHCDLFFADAAIIVEGAVEKLLMPTMIDKSDQRLKASYLTVLELGGAYAHIFESLFEFLCIPYLIITDIDSGVSGGRHEACRADTSGAVTTNATLKKRLSATLISDLQKLDDNRKIGHNGNSYITYQLSIPVVEKESSYSMLPRTFEEAFAYHNLEFLRSENLLSTVKLSESLAQIYDTVYQAIRSRDFKKTDFAMSILASSEEWKVPDYIVTGLKWLADRLHGDVTKGGK